MLAVGFVQSQGSVCHYSLGRIQRLAKPVHQRHAHVSQYYNLLLAITADSFMFAVFTVLHHFKCELSQWRNIVVGDRRQGNVRRYNTGWPKKVSRKLSSISSPNINRFSNVFHQHILWKIFSKCVAKYATTL